MGKIPNRLDANAEMHYPLVLKSCKLYLEPIKKKFNFENIETDEFECFTIHQMR